MNIIDESPADLSKKILSRALPVVQHFISKTFIEEMCRECGHRWRERFWGPALTMLACIYKQLANASARQVEDWTASLGDLSGSGPRDGHDFCSARGRLPLAVFVRTLWRLGALASNAGAWVMQGQRVLLVDGTTLRTPRTRENVATFGRSRNGKKKSRMPLARMVALICAGSAAVVDVALGGYSHSEMRLFRDLMERLEAGALLVADSGFSSFMVLWLAQERKCDILARHHQTRRGKPIKTLGEGDELHEWKRPKKPRVSWKDLLPQTPKVMLVRVISATVKREGYRDLELKLCTTLLDAKKHPASKLIALYMQRWNVELDFRTLKCEYRLERLTGKTPEIVLKEIYSTLIAYNAVQASMALSGKVVRKLSHTRARELLKDYCAQMSRAPVELLPWLFRNLLELIGDMQINYQDRPPEPRAIVEPRSVFPSLRISRRAWRVKYHAA